VLTQKGTTLKAIVVNLLNLQTEIVTDIVSIFLCQTSYVKSGLREERL
jgi:hypothetical protein